MGHVVSNNVRNKWSQCVTVSILLGPLVPLGGKLSTEISATPKSQRRKEKSEQTHKVFFFYKKKKEKRHLRKRVA
jgi:hypothetical protein